MSKQQIIIITGPTASGKSELAVAVAKHFNGEIISADSRQIYRGLDIGTGKVEGRWKGKIFVYKSIRHYCIGIFSPKKQCSAADFIRLAKKAIADIRKRGKIPIIAGGTGFWIDALVYGFSFPEVPPNKALRKKLAKKDAEKLFSLLKQLDPVRAGNIDPKNPHRLIRAIEIAKAIGRSPRIEKHAIYDTLWIGISIHPETLKSNIKKRLAARMREGIIQEAKTLRRQKLSWKRFYELGLEYRFLADFLRGETTKKAMREKLEYAIWHYAKRQLTWFKRNKNINWVQNLREAIHIIQLFLPSTDSLKNITACRHSFSFPQTK
ncbi:MAG: tRNA (adenosine(37)-N6)-dimethylallyltransferase MiaA [Candidatus Sungbacteria bacterium]|nr:tRNA (adenosine(37)-N6)-dimethylallyltransferase MiaA [Candidatus Sungbacteria bacterium]